WDSARTPIHQPRFELKAAYRTLAVKPPALQILAKKRCLLAQAPAKAGKIMLRKPARRDLLAHKKLPASRRFEVTLGDAL
ncbi:MAG: hypothetical protein M3255_09885, partial [Pseudomonadota bacterium]|nr:hypothetical protein [Pseudomonadota bacterium]